MIIGDGTYISVGAKVINCKVRKNCVIAPNAVAYRDMRDGEKCFNSVFFSY